MDEVNVCCGSIGVIVVIVNLVIVNLYSAFVITPQTHYQQMA